MKPSNYKCVIDLEASGLSSQSYPIEVGIVLDTGQRYQSLIRPLEDWTHWDPSAEALHGISRAELLKQGRPIRKVCEEINELCLGQTLYSDCWVFDNSWLNNLFARAGIPRRFACAPIEMMLTEQQLGRFAECKSAVSEHDSVAKHRAMNDALVIQKALHLLQGSANNPATPESDSTARQVLPAATRSAAGPRVAQFL